MTFCNWQRETRHLCDTLSALSFRDKEEVELTPEEGFIFWRDRTVEAREKQHICYFIGNGASASMASHFSADMAKNAHVHTQVFSDLSLITAVSNDMGFNQVFAEPLRCRGKPGDILVAISSSGQSENILTAVDQATALGMTIITLSAMKGDNALRQSGDLNAYVPATGYGLAETCHATILHHWMDMVSRYFDPESGPQEVANQNTASHLFDRARLNIKPLAEREHDLTLDIIKPVVASDTVCGEMAAVGEKIVSARKKGAPVILMMGAHLLRAGTQRFIIDLMEKGFVTALCLNGGGLIHDYEFSLIGSTTESVCRYIAEGQFGLWKETGKINDIVVTGAKEGKGLGESVGDAIEKQEYPHRDISILAAGHRLGVPVTVHVGIGYDIVFEHPNCDGAAYGAASYDDFLRFAKIIENLEDGVVMNFGSAVMAPEIFLKALAMARNVAKKHGGEITRFTTLVADLRPPHPHTGKEPDRGSPDYYFRPFKTMLHRSVSGGGKGFYVQGDHADTFPQLWTAVTGGV